MPIEDIFPLTVSFPQRLGPSWSTDLVTTESGREYRNKNWKYPRARGFVALNAARAERMAILRRWVYNAAGRANSFRVKDVTDYKVPDDSGTGGMTLVTGDGGTGSVFQMEKWYTVGSHIAKRRITKPTVGATAVYDSATSGETLKLLHTHYEIDESTGLVTIAFDPDGAVTWKGTFEIPMRFDADDQMIEAIDRQGPDAYFQSLNEIPLIEVLVEP